MFQQLIQWIRALFGKITGQKMQGELQDSSIYKRRYENIQRINFDAIFAGSLANKAVTDCNLTITDANDSESKRSQLIASVLDPVWKDIKPILSQALGKGGKFLIPYVTGNRIYIAAVDQDRCLINRVNGAKEIVSLSVAAERREVGSMVYHRVIDYTLDNQTLCIKTRILNNNGGEAGFDAVPDWADITPEFSIGNALKMPVGFLKSPRDSRKEDSFYGVPITHGAEDTIRQLRECMEAIENEYRLKRAFVGADELLFGKDNRLPESGLFKKFRGAGTLDNGSTFWEIFDPAIRDSSYYNRFNSLCAQLEREVGTSKGILTEPATFGATATEIKSANHDTFCLVSDIRKNIESCFDDLAYAADLYAERFGLSPAGAAGDYKLTFDWDMSLIESSTETFNQLSELESRGLISGARLNSWVTGQSMEDAQAEIDAIEKTTKPLNSLLELEEMANQRPLEE